MLRLTALLILCCAPGLATAQDACRNGGFPLESQTFGLAKVVGGPRVYLRGDNPPCPDDSAACRNRVYVIPGDTVLTAGTSGAFVCAFFPGKGGGGSAGFVRHDEIATQPSSNPAIAAWAGTWWDGDDSIALRVRRGQLVASGNAYWPSANPSLKDRPGGPNLGEMSGIAAPKGNSVVFAGADKDDCRVALTLLPPYLIASDNENCGGMNVRFTGVYQKK